MNGANYYNIITQGLDYLSCRIRHSGSVNLHDVNIHAEYFFRDFLKQLFDWRLVNANDISANMLGVDLLCDGNMIVVQVTSIVKKEKVQHSLDTLDVSKFQGYRFKFLSIAEKADKLRSKSYSVPSGIQFDPVVDILDIPSLYATILSLPIDRQKALAELVQKHLGVGSPTKRMKGLGRIIQILSSGKYLHEDKTTYPKNVFEIEQKISKNGLDGLQDRILDLSLYQPDVDKVYSEYDAEGVNKSRAVLYAINSAYLQVKKELSGQDLFEAIADKLYNGLQGDAQLMEYDDEDVRYYLDILLVDAFVRCKIFEKPNTI